LPRNWTKLLKQTAVDKGADAEYGILHLLSKGGTFMNSLLGRKKIIAGFLLPGVIVYSISVVIPILWSIWYSFFDWNGYGAKEFCGLSNYLTMLSDKEMWQSVGHTINLSVWQVVLQVGGGLVLAVILSRMVVFKRVFQTLYYLPVIISSVALCQMFKKIFAVMPPGLFNQLLSAIRPEWIHLEWLTNIKTSLGMVIFTTGYKNVAVYMLIFYSALLTVPHSLTEAARIDGAGSWQIFRRITLPHLKPAMIANVILVMNGSLRSYDIPVLLTAGGPVNTSQTQALYMYKQAFTSMKYGYGSALAMFIVFESLLFAILIQLYSVRSKGE